MSERKTRSPWVGSLLRLCLGVALFVLLILWIAPSWDEIESKIVVDVKWLAFGLAGTAFATLAAAWRWQLLNESMGASTLPYGVYFYSFAVTRLIGQFLPMLAVDLLGRGVALKAAGSRDRLGHLMAPVVLERLLDFLLPAVMLGWALWIHFAGPAVEGAWAWGSWILVNVVFIAVSIPALQPAARFGLRCYAWLRKTLRRGISEVEPASVSRGVSARVALLAVARWIGVLVQYWGAGAGVGIVLPALVVASAAPLAQLAGLVGITPGGLGVVEGGWVASLAQLGYDEATIVIFMTATRLAVVFNFAVLSLVGLPWRRVAAPAEAPTT